MRERVDVLGIGNAIVDVIAGVDDGFLGLHGLDKGAMRLVDGPHATALYAAMPPATESSGGSAANSCVGVAAMGGRAGFIGRVAADQLGQVFAHDLRAAGVGFSTAAATDGEPTGRCLVLVTPDGERTMSTFLGAAQELSAADVDMGWVRDAAVTYLEGYLWDPPAPRAALRQAAAAARDGGGAVAFTLSDSFCVERHRADFLAFLRQVDILFANEAEVCSLYQTTLAGALDRLADAVPLAVVTRGAMGAVTLHAGERLETPAVAVADVVDTTGAGDLFAAGFLLGRVRGRPLGDCAIQGAIAAAEVIGHVGARPQADLRRLVAAGLAGDGAAVVSADATG